MSVSELRRNIFWAGGAVPTGHLEKSDLVAALRKALVEKEQKEVEKAEKAKKERDAKFEKYEKAYNGVPRADARPLNYEQKQPKEQQEVINLHVLSEEQLKERIVAAGGEVPEGEVGKFFLVSALKNALKLKEQLESQVRQSADADAAAFAAAATAAPPPPPPPQAAADGTAAACSAAAKQKMPPPEEDEGEPFEDIDPSKLSAKELRTRILSYGARGEEKLRGLSEKPEFINALREAIAEWGPPRQRKEKPKDSKPPTTSAPVKPKVLSEAQQLKQMAELQAQMEADALGAAADAGQTAVDEAEKDEVVQVSQDVAAAAEKDKPKEDERKEKTDRKRREKPAVDPAAGAAARAARKERAAKRAKLTSGMVVSDGEDEVCAVAGPPIALEEEDDVCAVAPTGATPGAKRARREKRGGDVSAPAASSTVAKSTDAPLNGDATMASVAVVAEAAPAGESQSVASAPVDKSTTDAASNAAAEEEDGGGTWL